MPFDPNPDNPRKKLMSTLTARRHIEKSLRNLLKIRNAQASDIVSMFGNQIATYGMDVDMRGCVAIMNDCRTSVGIHLPDTEGLLDHVVSIDVREEDLVRWNQLPLAEAYAIPAGMRLRPEPTRADATVEELALNDLDDAMGPVPEPRDFAWKDGKILSYKVEAAHVVVEATVDGVASNYAMLPLFGNADDLGKYVAERVGVECRLCIEDACGDTHGIVIPEGMPIIDMAIPQDAVPGLRRELRHAA
jgi:hypothetical protein